MYYLNNILNNSTYFPFITAIINDYSKTHNIIKMSVSKCSFSSIENERYQHYSLVLHQRRLKEINQKSPRAPLKQNSKHKSRKLPESFSISKKELEQRNLLLLKKLIDIAQSKDKAPLRSITPLPRTLNGVNRKKEFQRINEENRKIADRIASKSPVLNSKLLAKDFLAHNRYREILVKYSLFNQKRNFSNKQLESLDKYSKGAKSGKISAESSKKIDAT